MTQNDFVDPGGLKTEGAEKFSIKIIRKVRHKF